MSHVFVFIKKYHLYQKENIDLSQKEMLPDHDVTTVIDWSFTRRPSRERPSIINSQSLKCREFDQSLKKQEGTIESVMFDNVMEKNKTQYDIIYIL